MGSEMCIRDRYTSAHYVSTLNHSIKMIGKDATVIKQFLTKNEDNGTSKQLCIRAQRTLDNAQPKLNFIHVLGHGIEHMKGMLAEVLPIRADDDVQFSFHYVRGVTLQVCLRMIGPRHNPANAF